MAASKELWNKLRAAQDAKNVDAATAYREAVEHANKGKMKDAEWWEKMGDDAMSTKKETPKEYATR